MRSTSPSVAIESTSMAPESKLLLMRIMMSTPSSVGGRWTTRRTIARSSWRCGEPTVVDARRTTTRYDRARVPSRHRFTISSMIQSRLPNIGTTIFTVMSSLATRHDAVNLGQGFPDFACDPRLIDAVDAAMRADTINIRR